MLDLCWSPDGNFLASASVDNSVLIWDVQRGVSAGVSSREGRQEDGLLLWGWLLQYSTIEVLHASVFFPIGHGLLPILPIARACEPSELAAKTGVA